MQTDRPLFFVGAVSPYSWLAAERIDDVIPDAQWCGVLAGVIFKARDRLPWSMQAGRESDMAECQSRASARGLGTIRWPDQWPTSDLRAARAMAYADTRGLLKPYVLSAMRLCFLEGRDLAVLDNVVEAGRRVGIEAGELEAALGEQPIKDAVRSLTDRAVSLGVHGVPTVAVGAELFWGDDRLEDAARFYDARRGG